MSAEAPGADKVVFGLVAADDGVRVTGYDISGETAGGLAAWPRSGPSYNGRMSHGHRTLARRQAWWWTAVLVLGQLAPGLSAALAHARGDFSAWQDVCRAATATPRAQQPAPIEAALDLLAKGHCPACHLGVADLGAPPAVPAGAMLRNDLSAEAPARFWSAPVTAHAWRPALARAPPALS